MFLISFLCIISLSSLVFVTHVLVPFLIWYLLHHQIYNKTLNNERLYTDPSGMPLVITPTVILLLIIINLSLWSFSQFSVHMTVFLPKPICFHFVNKIVRHFIKSKCITAITFYLFILFYLNKKSSEITFQRRSLVPVHPHTLFIAPYFLDLSWFSSVPYHQQVVNNFAPQCWKLSSLPPVTQLSMLIIHYWTF